MLSSYAPTYLSGVGRINQGIELGGSLGPIFLPSARLGREPLIDANFTFYGDSFSSLVLLVVLRSVSVPCECKKTSPFDDPYFFGIITIEQFNTMSWCGKDRPIARTAKEAIM